MKSILRFSNYLRGAVTLAALLACQPNPGSQQLMEEKGDLAELQAKFKPIERSAAAAFSGDELNLTLHGAGLFDGQELEHLQLAVKKIIDRKALPVSQDELSWQQQEHTFSLTIANQPQLYQFNLRGKNQQGKLLQRRFILQISADGIVQVQLTGQLRVEEVLSGSWQRSDQGYFIKWLENFDVEGPNLHRDGRDGVLAVHDQQVIWGQANGKISLGQMAGGKIEWLNSYHHGDVYDNDRRPTGLVIFQKYLYLTTFGNGLFIGKLVDDRIEWLSHQPEHHQLGSYLIKISIEDHTIAIGSYGQGFSLGAVDQGQIEWLNHYSHQLFEQAESDDVMALRIVDDQLFWSTGNDGLFLAHLDHYAISGIRHYPHHFSDPIMRLNVSSELIVADQIFVGTNDGRLAIGDFSEEGIEWYAQEHASNDRRMSDFPISAISDNDQVVVVGTRGNGVLIGQQENDGIRWFKRYTHKNRKGLGGDTISAVHLRRNRLFVAHFQGLSTGSVREWHHWQLHD